MKQIKIKTFKFVASLCGHEEKGRGINAFNADNIDDTINDFCKDKDVIDVKVNTIEHNWHNNGGSNGIDIIYTIIYRD